MIKALREWAVVWVLAVYATTTAATVLAPAGAQLRIEPVSGAAREHYDAGLQALSRNDLEEAERQFNAGSQQAANWSAPVLGLADVALRRQDSEKAEQLLRKAMAMAPDDPAVQTAWGRFAAASGRFSEAESALLRATELAPDAVEPRLELGALYTNALNRPADAVAAFKAATRISPDHAGAHHGLGMALIAAGEIDQGISELKRAAVLAPHNPLPRHALGRVYAGRKQFDQALAAYGDALRVQPGFSPSHIDRGNIFLARGQWGAAKQDFAAVVAIAPANAAAQLGLGVALQQLGEFDQARRAYLAALESDSKLAAAYNNLAWLDIRQQRPNEESLRRARQAVALSPQVADFHDTLGWLLHLNGANAEAKRSLEQAAAIQSTPHILYHLGSVYAALGEPQKARQTLRRALASDSSFDGASEAKELLEQLN